MTLALSLWAIRANAGICADIDLHFAGAPSRDLVVALEREATAIWAPYAVDLRWQTGACSVEDASFDLAIDRRAPLPTRQVSRAILGRTRVPLARIDRAPIWIDYDAVEETLGSLTTAQLTPFFGSRLGADEIGRALGRVVAHEIGHVLLGMSSHQRHGLMRESFGAIELVRRGRHPFDLSQDDIARLRQRLRIMRQLQATSASVDAAGQRQRDDGREASSNLRVTRLNVQTTDRRDAHVAFRVNRSRRRLRGDLAQRVPARAARRARPSGHQPVAFVV